jgi:NAD-reducing hydrogenase large subunit
MPTLTIEPITRIEGHARITLQMSDAGEVEDAKLHITQLRGFEKFCEGRPFPEMPSLTARTCGICPVSHLIASSKACDELMAVQIPPAAVRLRRVMNLAQLLQSHALSFFHLSSPDLLLGWDSDPAARNVFGLMRENPQLARDGIRLRQIGQSVIAGLGGKSVHPAWIVPGGVQSPMTEAMRSEIRALLPEAMEIAERTYRLYRGVVKRFKDESEAFGNVPTMFMGLVDAKGNLEHYDGLLRIKDSEGNIIEQGVRAEDYSEVIAEAVEPHSFVKSPYYRPMGYPHGVYRVGPLARLNIVERCGTPAADEALEEFRALCPGKPVSSSFHYHYARLVEMLFAVERLEQLTANSDILDRKVRARARSNKNRGVGISEAPRGTLIHDYTIDDEGRVSGVNLIVATGHNNLAMNRSVLQVARRYVQGPKVTEGMLNRVEAVIRCFDPCMSCASHEFGRMPLDVRVIGPDGNELQRVSRG